MLNQTVFVIFTSLVVIITGRRQKLDDDSFFGMTTTQMPSFTYSNFTKCLEVCEKRCTLTYVIFDEKQISMYNCIKLKQTETTFIDTIKNGSLQNTLIVIASITVVLILFIICIYYCCCSHPFDEKPPKRNDMEQEFFETIPREERNPINKSRTVIEC